MNDMILILNYSDEFAVEAAKRLRGERVFCKIISGTTTAAQVAEIAPRGLVLCGEPKSAAGAFDAEILKLDIPVLALGHAAHMLIAAMGGACAGAAISEKKANVQYADCKLFTGVEGGERYIQEAMTLMLPADVQVTAGAGGCTVAFEDSKRSLFGVQFELERNDPDGSTILKNFARDICGCTPWFTMDAALAEARRALTEASIEGGFAVCGVSGASGVRRADDGDLRRNGADARGRGRRCTGDLRAARDSAARDRPRGGRAGQSSRQADDGRKARGGRFLPA